jgi:hypothetical protein
MKVHYYINESGNKIGSLNLEKVKAMSDGKPVYSCDIAEYNGHLMSEDWGS